MHDHVSHDDRLMGQMQKVLKSHHIIPSCELLKLSTETKHDESGMYLMSKALSHPCHYKALHITLMSMLLKEVAVTSGRVILISHTYSGCYGVCSFAVMLTYANVMQGGYKTHFITFL